MSIKQFFNIFFKSNAELRVEKKNTQLRNELRALEEVEKGLKKNKS